MNGLSIYSSEGEKDFGKPLPTQIAEYIAKQIFQGTLSPGERLKEEELAKLFRTSRAPVREALYLLQIDGLVERLPRRGTVVRAYTDREIQELYEVRLSLEQLAVNRLQSHWSEEARAAFCEVLVNMQKAFTEGNSELYSDQNTRFHDLLFQIADSEILTRLYRQLTYPLQPLLQFSTQSQAQMQDSFEEHQEIVKCLSNYEFDLAKSVITKNVQHGLARAMTSGQKTNEKSNTQK